MRRVCLVFSKKKGIDRPLIIEKQGPRIRFNWSGWTVDASCECRPVCRRVSMRRAFPSWRGRRDGVEAMNAPFEVRPSDSSVRSTGTAARRRGGEAAELYTPPPPPHHLSVILIPAATGHAQRQSINHCSAALRGSLLSGRNKGSLA